MNLSKDTEKLTQQLRQMTKGKIFRVTFIKRTTGEKRVMVCRMGVKKGVTGEGQKYIPSNKGLITVFDVQKKAFRNISVEGIQEFKFQGNVYKMFI